MKINKKTRDSIHEFKEKIKDFFGKLLRNKKDATFGSNTDLSANEEAYRKGHEHLKTY